MSRFTDSEIEYITISGLIDEMIYKVIIKHDKYQELSDNIKLDDIKLDDIKLDDIKSDSTEIIKNNKKYKVNFNDINDILIINNNEYIKKEKLKSELWWTPAEQHSFKVDGINEAKEFIGKHPNLTYKQVLLKKYKIKVVKQNQLEPLNNVSTNSKDNIPNNLIKNIKTIINDLSDKNGSNNLKSLKKILKKIKNKSNNKKDIEVKLPEQITDSTQNSTTESIDVITSSF
jgi:hypothetical protein